MARRDALVGPRFQQQFSGRCEEPHGEGLPTTRCSQEEAPSPMSPAGPWTGHGCASRNQGQYCTHLQAGWREGKGGCSLTIPDLVLKKSLMNSCELIW